MGVEPTESRGPRPRFAFRRARAHDLARDTAPFDRVVTAVTHIARWDLDKTYLRTEFDSLRDILRTALERPDEKRTNPGASTLLREMVRAGIRVSMFIEPSGEALEASAVVTDLLTLARDPARRALQCEPVDLAAIVTLASRVTRPQT